jgi:hypothetical protein
MVTDLGVRHLWNITAHLLVGEIRLSEGDVELTGCEESVPLRSISIKMTGDTQSNSRGLR